MIPVSIHRHATRMRPSPERPLFTVGTFLSHERLSMHAVPRVGELITYHPDFEPSENSWTGVVTGIQHVVSTGIGEAGTALLPHTESLVCVTVRDEKEVEHA